MSTVSNVDLNEWYRTCEAAAAGVIQKVLAHLPDGGVLVDVGANVGVVTRAAIRERDATVYAFEPVEAYRDFCERRNPTARVRGYALGAEMDRKTLWCDSTNLGWNTFEAEKATPGMRPVGVRVLPLDMFPDIEPDVIKVDVEGYEWAVIRGAHRTIQTHRPVIVVEVGWGTDHPHREEVVKEMEWLFSIGYERVPYEFTNVTTDFVLTPQASPSPSAS